MRIFLIISKNMCDRKNSQKLRMLNAILQNSWCQEKTCAPKKFIEIPKYKTFFSKSENLMFYKRIFKTGILKLWTAWSQKSINQNLFQYLQKFENIKLKPVPISAKSSKTWNQILFRNSRKTRKHTENIRMKSMWTQI